MKDKNFNRQVITLAASGLMMLATQGNVQAETFTAVSFGGAYGAMQKVVFFDPYGVKIGSEILNNQRRSPSFAGEASTV